MFSFYKWDLQPTPHLAGSSQTLQLWWQSDFLLVRELFERSVLGSEEVDFVANPHVVIIHQLNVLPLLQRFINYKFLIGATLIHRLLEIFPFPVRLSARCVWCDRKRRSLGSSAFAFAVSSERFHPDSVREVWVFDSSHGRRWKPALHRWYQEMGKVRAEPKTMFQELIIAIRSASRRWFQLLDSNGLQTCTKI